MYSGTFNISSTTISGDLQWTDETYSGSIITGSSSFTGSLVIGDNPLLEQRVTDLENSWYHYATSVEYTGNDVSIATGDVLQCVYDGSTLYRYITMAESVNGYPSEDSFYTGFDGTNLTGLIVTRG